MAVFSLITSKTLHQLWLLTHGLVIVPLLPKGLFPLNWSVCGSGSIDAKFADHCGDDLAKMGIDPIHIFTHPQMQMLSGNKALGTL